MRLLTNLNNHAARRACHWSIDSLGWGPGPSTPSLGSANRKGKGHKFPTAGLKIKPGLTLEHNGRSQAKAGPVQSRPVPSHPIPIPGEQQAEGQARSQWPIKFEIKNLGLRVGRPRATEYLLTHPAGPKDIHNRFFQLRFFSTHLDAGIKALDKGFQPQQSPSSSSRSCSEVLEHRVPEVLLVATN